MRAAVLENFPHGPLTLPGPDLVRPVWCLEPSAFEPEAGRSAPQVLVWGWGKG